MDGIFTTEQQAMRVYPTLTKSDNKSLMDAINQISRLRKDDVAAWNNLTQVFISGRKVGTIPSGSTVTAVTDREGDFNYDSAHAYLAETIGSTLMWARWAISTTW